MEAAVPSPVKYINCCPMCGEWKMTRDLWYDPVIVIDKNGQNIILPGIVMVESCSSCKDMYINYNATDDREERIKAWRDAQLD